MSLQITGEENVLSALKNGEDIKLVLVDREEDCSEIIQLCKEKEIKVVEGSSTDLWRMSVNGQQKALAMVGREPEGTFQSHDYFQSGQYLCNLRFLVVLF